MALNKIEFKNYEEPGLSAENLNLLQDNIQDAISETAGGTPIGSGMDYFGTVPPDNYLFADGSAISRTEYSELFKIIGETYGNGDGETTFNLPDKRERVSVMYKEDSTNGTTNATLGTLGAKGGEFKHTMTTSELPSHNHTLDANVTGSYWASPLGYLSSSGNIQIGRVNENQNKTTGYTGNSIPLNVMQPYLVCNYIIKVK